MKKLIEILQELISTDHYNKRKIERIDNITDIYIPKEALGDFTLSQVKEPLIKYIQNVINKELIRLESSKDIPLSKTYRVGYKFFMPIIKIRDKKYPIILKTLEGTGTYYYVIIKDNNLITVIISDAKDFEKEIINHSKRKYEDENIKILKHEYIYPIDLNKVMGVESKEEEKISEKDLPYKVRTDYRINTPFEHNTYGKGTIVATSSGNTGKSDQRGTLDWIEVDFGKPFISGGKLQKTRKIPNVYAKTYFGVKALNEENIPINPKFFQQILDKSNISISNRKYFQNIINSIIKQNNSATPKQHELLQKLKTGDFKYHPKN